MADQQTARPPRLAIIVASERRRGAEVFGEALGEGLRGAGWNVELVSLTSSPDGPRVAATTLSPVTPDALGKLDRSVVAALRDHVKRRGDDIVLANGAATMQYAIAALRVMRHRPRLVYSSIGEPMFWIRSGRHRVLRALILKGVDRVFSVSATTARQLVEHLGVPAAKVRIAPTGVPERFFSVVGDGPAPQLRVVFIGNLSLEKDPIAGLDIIERVAAQVPVAMRYLGSGPLRERLEQEVATRRLSEVVEVVGSVPDVLPHLAWADVLLLTSRTEGLPGVPLEAGAAGVPSVVYAAGGAAETVIDGVTGRVVPLGDVAAAAAALIELAGDPDRRRAWGEAARRMVAEHFTLEAAVERYIDLLSDELAAASGIAAGSASS
jgi:glycosyltransferase involved in cell wall biosynthesis